jgi:DNA adenine methylase
MSKSPSKVVKTPQTPGTPQKSGTVTPKSTISNTDTEEYLYPIERPILKWIGGKTQIIGTLISKFPKSMDSYHEIFLGGSSVLLALLTGIKNKEIIVNKTINAYDYNETLIHMYKNIQSNPNEVYKELNELIKDYHKTFDVNNKSDSSNSSDDDSSEDSDEDEQSNKSNKNNKKTKIINRKPKNHNEAMTSGESYYYWIRISYNKLSQANKNTSKGSAMFIFLNKTCFRGMFREGPNGFNVPYGNYVKPEIINKQHLMDVSKLIKNVNFVHADFSISLNNVKSKDFVYLDPPYAPETKTSFVGYNKDGFSIDLHEKLFNICSEMKLKKIKFIMSNADVELVRTAFPPQLYNTDIISCKRSINSKKPGSKTNEVIIKSF